MHVSNRNTQIIPYKSLDFPYDKGFYYFSLESGQKICTNEFINLVTAKKDFSVSQIHTYFIPIHAHFTVNETTFQSG